LPKPPATAVITSHFTLGCTHHAVFTPYRRYLRCALLPTPTRRPASNFIGVISPYNEYFHFALSRCFFTSLTLFHYELILFKISCILAANILLVILLMIFKHFALGFALFQEIAH
jgi:hypothetical protein